MQMSAQRGSRGPGEVGPRPGRGTKTRQRHVRTNILDDLNARQAEQEGPLMALDEQWGDDLRRGSDLPTGTFRLFSQNINGLAPRLGQQKISTVVDSMNRRQASMVALQETNTNWRHPSCQNLLPRALQRAWQMSKVVTSTANIPFDTRDQPGGTCLWVTDQWVPRVVTSTQDEGLGRWTSITLQGTGSRLITFISAYRVCMGTVDLSHPFAVASQQRALLEAQGRHISPRGAMLHDLTVFVRQLQAVNQEVVLCIDANEAMSTGECPPNEFDQLLRELNLIEVLAHRHGPNGPATHMRGRHRIDFIAVTAGLVTAIQATGILPLADGHDSDHRALFVDFDGSLVFQGPTAELKSTDLRQLTLSNSKALEVYILTLQANFTEHKIYSKLQTLAAKLAQEGPTEANIADYEKLDRWITARMLHAERKCSPARRQGNVWSPQLRQATLYVRYWALRVKQARQRRQYGVELHRLAVVAEVPPEEVAGVYTLAILNERVRQAARALRGYQREAGRLREQHLQERADKLAAQRSTGDAAKIVQTIKARECASRQFKLLRKAFNQPHRGLEFVDVPDMGMPGQVTRLFDREAVHEAILQSNLQRFQQTKQTPFGQSERHHHMGKACEGPGTRDILRGKYRFQRAGLSAEAKVWISMLRYRRSVAQGETIDTNITASEFASAWSRFRESTSSSPSGRHYGHYKAAAAAYLAPAELADGSSNCIHTQGLASVHAMMCRLPGQYGFAPTRWSQSINAMLEKSNKSTQVDKLRIIHLFEADFNYILKCIWGRRLVRHSEQKGWLGQEQHGSRPGRQAIDGVMEKRLLYDIARLSRTSIITIDNDARSCYDRIVKTLAMTACVSQGLPKPAAVMHNLVQYGMVHRVKTAHGVSANGYTNPAERLLEGTGQGSGASPAIWLVLSSLMIRALSRFVEGMRVATPSGAIARTLYAVFYVDDGMPGVSDFGKKVATSWQTLCRQASETAQSWERLLHTSGGALETSKCFTYAIYWAWHNGRPHLVDPTTMTDRVTVIDSETQVQTTLEMVNPKVGRRTLGVRIAPDGTDVSEFAYRMSQAREVVASLTANRMSRVAAWVGYRMVVTPKVEYPLAATNFSTKQCKTLMAAYIPSVLRRTGLPRNFPRAVTFAGVKAGGLGFHHLEVEQGAKQMTYFIGNVRQGTRVGDMLRITLAWAQLQAGVSYDILGNPSSTISWVDPCWIMAMRRFMSEHGFKIRMANSGNLQPPPRFNDCALMEELAQHYKGVRMLQLNACRMYLRVQWLSDITSGDGQEILASALLCMRTTVKAPTELWPRQERPPSAWRIQWRKALQTIFLRGRESYNLQRTRRLGRWNHVNIRAWSGYFDPESQVFFRRDIEGRVFRHLPRRPILGMRIAELGGSVWSGELPPATVPATYRLHGATYEVSASERVRALPTRASTDDILQYISEQPAWMQRLLQGLRICSTEKLFNAPALASMELATDGSLKNGRGAFAWVMAVQDEVLASCEGPADGFATFHSSTRAELIGLASGLNFVYLLQQVRRKILGPGDVITIRVSCDNKGALGVVERAKKKLGSTPSLKCRENADVECVIRWLTDRLISPIKCTWVKGHQTEQDHGQPIDLLVYLNNKVDKMAAQAWCAAVGHEPSPKQDLWEPAVCDVVHEQAGTITGALHTACRNVCGEQGISTYFATKYKWDKSVGASLDRHGYACTIPKYNYNDRIRITKLRTGWLPVNGRACHYIAGRLPQCPSCQEKEDISHLFCCREAERSKVWLAGVTFQLRGLAPGSRVTEGLVNGIRKWQQGEDMGLYAVPENHVQEAIEGQKSMGWQLVCRGIICRSWQAAYDASSPKDHTGGWGAAVHKILFDAFLRLWEARNEAVHGTVAQQVLNAESELVRQIRALYGDENRVSPADKQWIFPIPLETLLQRPREVQRQWYRLATRVVPPAVHRATTGQRGQTRITGYFPPRSGLADDPP